MTYEARYTVTARDPKGRLALAYLHQSRREADRLVERLRQRPDIVKVRKEKEGTA